MASGFRYAKSGPHCSKKVGDFTFQVQFNSSSRNVAGALVKLWISGTVYSKRLERWRANFPLLRGADYVAGGQIGNLTDQVVFNDWNLADSNTRDTLIADAVCLVEGVALPYFTQFEDLSGTINRVVSSDVPSFTISNVVEFLMCYADTQTARKAAANFLDRRPSLVSSYRRELARYAQRGLNWRTSAGHATQLALASHLFGLGDLTET